MARKIRKAAGADEAPSGPLMPLQNYDPVVVFYDGSKETIKVQGAGPVAAIYTAAMAIRRDWSIDKQLRVVAITVPTTDNAVTDKHLAALTDKV